MQSYVSNSGTDKSFMNPSSIHVSQVITSHYKSSLGTKSCHVIRPAEVLSQVKSKSEIQILDSSVAEKRGNSAEMYKMISILRCS